MECTYRIYPGVKLGRNASIGDYCVIGVQPEKGKELETVIGDNATIRSHSVIYAGNRIGDNLTTGHACFIQQNNVLGNNVSIGTKSVILRNATIGNNVRVHTNSFIPEFTVIKDGAWIGPHVVITNTFHPLCRKSKECMARTFVTIEEGAIIGANVTILPGVRIGRNSVVGAGSVVRRNVPPRTIVGGNLAREIKDISKVVCQTGLVDKPY